MINFAPVRRWAQALFPERHIYLRSGGEMRAFVLTSRKQMLAAGGAAAIALWMGVSTAAMLIGMIETSAAHRRLAADEARLTAVAADGQAAAGPVEALAAAVERRHQALALLLADPRIIPNAGQALAPALTHAAAAGALDPLRRVQQVRLAQEELLKAADAYAITRAERLRLALRLAGIAPAAARAHGAAAAPRIEPKDPRALAAVLDVDPEFAASIQRAAADFAEARNLSDEARGLPLARPTHTDSESSGFGVRTDPITNHAAFHPGLDFPGGRMTPVYATAPGVVAFTGVRAGYGETVEIDHGRGFKTRYAHLAHIDVRPGQQVAQGAQIGGMGSTGRSTGTHLHYEVWVNGRVQNPDRFVKAGAYVLQTG